MSAEIAALPATEPEEATSVSERRIVLRRFCRHRLALIGTVVLVLMAVACFGAPWLAPAKQGAQDLLLGPTQPSWQHLLGTDDLGRDYLSELLYAGRISLSIGFFVSVFATVLGTAVGAVSGYLGGLAGEVIMRITDLFLIVPVVAILAVALQWLGSSPSTIVLVLAGLSWPYIARVVRSQVLSLREKEFVEAAKVLGASTPRILVRHLLPNLVGLIVVNISLATASAIIVESTLSFLGFGVQSPQTSWGSMLSQASGLVGTPQVYLLYFPGLFILLTVLCVNFIGDGLRDALDPQGKQL